MKLASAIVVHEFNTIKSVTVIPRNDVEFSLNSILKDKAFDSFQSLYNHVLNVIHENGYEVPYQKMFEARWYDIFWIDIRSAEIIDRYPLKHRNHNA